MVLIKLIASNPNPNTPFLSSTRNNLKALTQNVTNRKPKTSKNEALIKKALLFLLLLTVLALAGAMWFFQNQQSEPKPSYTEPWRSAVWNNALCRFFAVSSDKRDVALLNEGLSKALGNEEVSTAVETCPALSSLSSNLSAREVRLFEMLQSVTVLPGSPLNTADNNALALMSFIEQYGPLTTADMRVYEVDIDNKLFAYELRFKDARAYVMYNFSFDTHPLPLPLGFMASTKITLYRTDNPTFKRFVTSGPLSITYHSAVVVIVD
ncbi:hypothetical protein [Alteromonas sp. BMJM2]|uniref:hypothetical protein n=1 Tax=Alteromonas sp. BMJM2 TaxID=2954241 RepID=UPI0022B56838|nr:hypothetical protein [Alteromonas sp. BMJM2]